MRIKKRVMYKLRYLPLAQKDLLNIADYISDVLKAPDTAMNLIDALEESILGLKKFPFSCRVYHPEEFIETEYRCLPVKNFLVFYTVKGYEVEIHRIIYAKMDLGKIIK